MMRELKHGPMIRVAIAIVEDSGRWLVNRRLSGDALDGLWEFPGGKIHAGESPAAAATREAREEVGLDVVVGDELPTVTHGYGTHRVELHPVRCGYVGGEPAARNSNSGEVRWVDSDELRTLAMPAGNRSVVDDLLSRFGRRHATRNAE